MTATPSAERKSNWIPWAFVGFFMVVILANGIMAFFAFSTWTGLSTDGAYQKGLAYNRTLETRTRQAALGWHVAVALEPGAAGNAALTAVLKDRSGAPLWADSVVATLTRPTHEGHDLAFPLDDKGEGRFTAEVGLALPGVWDLTLTVVRGKDRLDSQRRLFWSP